MVRYGERPTAQGPARGCPGPQSPEFIVAFTNAAIEHPCGQYRIEAPRPAPIQSLDRALNPKLPVRFVPERQGVGRAGGASPGASGAPAATAEEESATAPVEESASASAAATGARLRTLVGDFSHGRPAEGQALLRAAGIRFRIPRPTAYTTPRRGNLRAASAAPPLRDYQRQRVWRRLFHAAGVSST